MIITYDCQNMFIIQATDLRKVSHVFYTYLVQEPLFGMTNAK